MKTTPIINARNVRRARTLLLLLVALPPAYVGVYFLVVRYGLTNFGVVVPGQVYRSAQPDGAFVEEVVDAHKIRTVVNLRGPEHSSVYQEVRRAAVEKHVRHLDIKLSAMRPPPRPELLRLIDVLDDAPRPLLLHCRAGADRTGMASVLAAMAIAGEPYVDAKRHLNAWHLHIGWGTHIEDVLTEYEKFCRANNRDTGGWHEFKAWARDIYYVDYYSIRIDAPETAAAKSGETLSVQITVTNTSPKPIPLSAPGRRFILCAFRGDTRKGSAEEYYGGVDLPTDRDLEPGDSITAEIDVTLPAPSSVPETYQVGFDVYDKDRFWFATHGSPNARTQVTVN